MQQLQRVRIIQHHVQKIGDRLTDMVMPNMGAFIAWGLMAACFSPTGFFPHAGLGGVVTAIGRYLLPLMLAYTGARVTGGQRGGLVAAIATIGLIASMHDLALLGAMILGPLCGWLTKKLDRCLHQHVRQGFELLVDNFSAGILGMLMALIGYLGLAPIVDCVSRMLALGANWLIDAHLIPLANVVIEPAKVLFMNNVINHGILNPIGTEQAAQTGHSLLFLLETNPGPGLGILLAFAIFGHGRAKKAAPGAIIIHALGGIHEIYFPYILQRPQLLLAVIAGGVSGTATFDLLNIGLRADPAPGSIISILLLTPASLHNYLGVIAGVTVSTVVAFAIAVLLLPRRNAESVDTTNAIATSTNDQAVIITGTEGMGSPDMGARILRAKLQEHGITNVTVTAQPINTIAEANDAIIFVMEDLVAVVQEQAPEAKDIIGIRNYLNTPAYDDFLRTL